MGKLVDGRWTTKTWTRDKQGAFVRGETAFRDAITADGPHPPASGRYHLYVSYACPWAHRTLIARALLGLEEHVSVSVVDPFMTDEGWHFSERDGAVPDPHLGANYLRDVYRAVDDEVTTRVTVPVLWDIDAQTIVNNESREIVRMFDRVLAPALTGKQLTPPTVEAEVDALADRFYNSVNNGVYRCGFAKSQGAYETAFAELFEELDRLDARLADRQWLVGDQLTDADIFLFTTLVRFDAVYVTHFKCNGRRIADYAHLQAFLERMLEIPEVFGTVRMDHIHEHYHRSHESINPHRILPRGPRDHFSARMLAEHPSPVPGDAEPPRPPKPSADKLSEEELQPLLEAHPEWTREGDRIRREWRFEDFETALSFVNHVGSHAEALFHHPDIELGWGRVTLSLTTHDSGGLSRLDFALADAIDGR